MIRPELCAGPACPYCGCRDVQIPQQALSGSWYASGGAVCNHCRRRFAFTPMQQQAHEPIVYQEPTPVVTRSDHVEDPVLRCPKCGAKAGRKGQKGPTVERSMGKIRYHSCPCGHRFKTVERD